MPISVWAPALSDTDAGVALCFRVEGMREPTLKFHVSGADRSFIPETLEPALLALLVPAMIAESDLSLYGPISAELLFRVQKYVVPLLCLSIPHVKPIAIHASDARETSLDGDPAVLIGFSNGIDSFYACAAHLSDSVPRDMRVTHFVFHDAGSHGKVGKPRTSKLASRRLEKVRASARAMGRPVIHVATNITRFYSKLSYQQTHTLRSAAVGFALGRRAKRYLYASTYDYSEVSTKGKSPIAVIDPILLPLLKSETMDCFSTGAPQTRVEKTAVVSGIALAQTNLDVCVAQTPNCSCCWKCARTLFTLELLNKQEAFGAAFDIATFRKVRDDYIAHIIATSTNHPLNGEIRSLMRASGFRPSSRHWLKAILLSLVLRASAMVATARHQQGLTNLYRKIAGFPADH